MIRLGPAQDLAGGQLDLEPPDQAAEFQNQQLGFAASGDPLLI